MSGRLRSGRLRATPEKDEILLRNSGKKTAQKTLFHVLPKESGSADDEIQVSPCEAEEGRKGQECGGTNRGTVVCGLPSCTGYKRIRNDGDDKKDEGLETLIKKPKEETLDEEVSAVQALEPENVAGNEVREEDGKVDKCEGQDTSLGRPKEAEGDKVAEELINETNKIRKRRGRPPKLKSGGKVVNSEAKNGEAPNIQKAEPVVKIKAKRGRPPKRRKKIKVLESEAMEAVKPEENESNEVAQELMEKKPEKGKRGRPLDVRGNNDVLKSVDIEAVKSEEDESLKVAKGLMKKKRKKKKKGKRGRPRKIQCENEVLETADVEAMIYEEDRQENIKCERPPRIGRKNEFFKSVDVGAVKSEEDKSNEVAGRLMKKGKRKGKRGRPRKIQGENVVLNGADIEAVNPEEDENSGIGKRFMTRRKKKGKRGRPPKLQVVNGEPRTFHKGNLNGLARRKKGIGMNKGLKRRMATRRAEMVKRSRGDKLYVEDRLSPYSRRKHLDMEMSKVDHFLGQSLGEETLVSITMQGSRKQIKKKTVEGENVLSRKKQKQLIRDQILKLLFSAGWTVHHRPRQGRKYEDAVYVSPDGKTHWSITLAYKVLKRRYEKGHVDHAYKQGFVFTPIPEEEIQILTRIITKKRVGKKKDKCMEGKVKVDGVPTNKKMKRKRNDCGRTGLSKLVRKKRDLETMTDDSENEMPLYSGNRRRRQTQNRKRYALLVRNSGGTETDSKTYVLYNGKRTVLAWMIDLGIVPHQGKVQYMDQKKPEVMLEGRITEDGILCDCCGEVIALSEFERHARSKSCLALQNIYLENGNSLLQCAIESWNKQEPEQNWFYFIDVQGDDPNDDTCGICGDGGNLVCCDSCPSTFHQSCLDIERFPSGDWNCVYCSCKFCGTFRDNESRGNDDGDVPESALLTCILCRAKYHSSCRSRQDGLEDLDKLALFCGKSCEEIYEGVQLLLGVKHEMAEGFSWTLLQRSDVADLMSSEVSWKVECNSKLAVALSVMDECFCPLTDHRSGINLIRNILYNCGSNFNRLDFRGFYTVVLERGEEIISAASIRIHGSQLAEMPFIGTRYVYRRQGMCRRLLSAIESVLRPLNVEKLVIPAVSEVKQTWTSVFNFVPVEVSTRERMRGMNILVFPGVDMLQKPLLDHHFPHENPNTAKGLKCSGVEGNKTIIDLNTIPEASADILHPINGQLAARPDSQLLDRSSNDISDIMSACAYCPNNDKCAAQLEMTCGTGENIKNVNGQHFISDNHKQIAKADVSKSGGRDVELDDGSYNYRTSVTKCSFSGNTCPVSGYMNGVEWPCDALVYRIEDVALSLKAKRTAADVFVEELKSVQVDGTCLPDVTGKKSSCVDSQVSDKTNGIACTDREELTKELKSNGNMLLTTLSPGALHAKTSPIACNKSASKVCPPSSARVIDVSTSKFPGASDDCDHRCNGLDHSEKKADFPSVASKSQSSLGDSSHAVTEPELRSYARGHRQAKVALLDTCKKIEGVNYGAKDGSTLTNLKPLAESGSNHSELNLRVSSDSDAGSMVDHASVPECIGESLCKPSLVHV